LFYKSWFGIYRIGAGDVVAGAGAIAVGAGAASTFLPRAGAASD
jgi:hypothetical protein